MTGPTPDPTFEPVLTGMLFERYDVSTPVPRTMGERELAVVLHRCGLRARAWMDDNDVDAPINEHVGTDEETGEHTAGVWWDVVVGRGVSPDTGGLAVVHGVAWTWSARWEHWAGWFQSMRLAAKAQARGEGASYATGQVVVELNPAARQLINDLRAANGTLRDV